MSTNQTHDPYALIPELYDLEHDSFDADLPFYLNSVVAIGDPVLELGCGTGRLLFPIAKAGYRITGLDLSPSMLARGKARAPRGAAGKRITWFEGPMEAADKAPGGPFGVVLIPLNGLMHATSQDDQIATLTAARQALDPRGQLIIDVFHPTPQTLSAFDGSVLHDGSWTTDDGVQVDKFSSRRCHPAEQLIATSIWYDVVGQDGTLRRTATSFDQRYVHPGELELLLKLAGFASWEIYGGYDLEPFDDDAERMLVTAEAS